MSISLNSGQYNDKGLYRTPAGIPLKIYAWNELYSDYPVSEESTAGNYTNGIAVIYRIYVYNYTDYSNVRTGITANSAETPNSLSGTYIAKYLTDNNGGDLDLESGIYIIEYVIQRTQIRIYNPTGSITETPLSLNSWIYQIAVTNNRLPLKKWTILDVINRVHDTIMPLRYGEKPRFRLSGVIYDDTTGNAVDYEQGSLAEKLDKIIAPEYAFTKMTLREMYKQIGGFIHAEARIKAVHEDENVDPQQYGNKLWYEVTFDKYGSNEYSNISKRRYVSATFGTDINEYCTALDSSVDNLVNQLDWAQGVITEPFNSGYKSLRTEIVTARMAEDNSTFIATDFPIYVIGSKKQVICRYIPGIGEGNWDITPYIFEEADYNNLSSYQGIYPYSKAYALYYSQGQKNIKGLFFKADHALSPVFRKYAIINILESVTGQTINLNPVNYPQLSFSVTYLPIFSTRVKTNKQTVIGGIPRTLAYNQGANLIETRYYGENLKGAVARLGNVEKTYTYNLAFLSDVPKVGKKFDDNYYISAVYTEILPTYIKCTVALSKDFNRLSEYVGISSNKRMWEVSEKQSVNRDSVITNYCLITQSEDKTSDGTTTDGALFGGLANKLLNNDSRITYPCTSAVIHRYTKNRTRIAPNYVTLPVVSTALGNSMLFSFKFEDNYSAGQQSLWTDGDKEEGDDVTGYWGNYTSYCDYYGRYYYSAFTLICGQQSNSNGLNTALENPITYPSGGYAFVTSHDKKLFKYRKDSREIPAITIELTAVTDDESIIIGSALMRNCGLVNASPKTYRLWAFRNKLNVIDGKPDLDFSNADYYTDGITVTSEALTIADIDSSQYVAWAIVTDQEEKTIQVEDEDGNETTQKIYEGGELVIGQNKIPEKKSFYFLSKKRIYD